MLKEGLERGEGLQCKMVQQPCHLVPHVALKPLLWQQHQPTSGRNKVAKEISRTQLFSQPRAWVEVEIVESSQQT